MIPLPNFPNNVFWSMKNDHITLLKINTDSAVLLVFEPFIIMIFKEDMVIF